MPNRSHLDALAQQQGFKNYEQWSAWNAQQQARRLNNGINGTPYNTGAQPAQPENWLQHLINNYTPLGLVAKRLNDVL